LQKSETSVYSVLEMMPDSQLFASGISRGAGFLRFELFCLRCHGPFIILLSFILL